MLEYSKKATSDLWFLKERCGVRQPEITNGLVLFMTLFVQQGKKYEMRKVSFKTKN